MANNDDTNENKEEQANEEIKEKRKQTIKSEKEVEKHNKADATNKTNESSLANAPSGNDEREEEIKERSKDKKRTGSEEEHTGEEKAEQEGGPLSEGINDDNADDKDDDNADDKDDEKTGFIDKDHVIRTIVLGRDWQEVLMTLVAEEDMDPLKLDIVELANAFLHYLNRLKTFDFRIPARFVLIAAILLRMKAELLLEEEEEKIRLAEEKIPKISLDDIPQLLPPITRKTTRKVTLDELVGALQKAFEFKGKKEERELRIRRKVVALIDEEEDIEEKISRIFEKIMRKGRITFTGLVPTWQRKEIVETFMPLLHLCMRGKVNIEQEEFFKEIYVTVR